MVISGNIWFEAFIFCQKSQFFSAMLRSFPGRNFIGKSPALNVHGLKCFSVLRSPTSPVKLSQWGGAYLKSSVTERVVLQQQLLNEDSPFFGATAKMLKSSKQGLQLAMSLREDIKYCQKHSSDTANLMSKWKQFDSFLKNWLGIVFSESMLDLRQVHFSSASGEVLQYIAETEAVHPVTSVEGLKHRFGNGRRCYALFLNHGAGGGPYTLPLAYIHVGLTEHYSPSLQYVPLFPCLLPTALYWFYSSYVDT